MSIPYPLGKYCMKLGEKGLIGKIRLLSTMTVEEVEDEVWLSMIRSTAQLMSGSAGPLGLDARAWQRLCSSFTVHLGTFAQ